MLKWMVNPTDPMVSYDDPAGTRLHLFSYHNDPDSHLTMKKNGVHWAGESLISSTG